MSGQKHRITFIDKVTMMDLTLRDNLIFLTSDTATLPKNKPPDFVICFIFFFVSSDVCENGSSTFCDNL